MSNGLRVQESNIYQLSSHCNRSFKKQFNFNEHHLIESPILSPNLNPTNSSYHLTSYPTLIMASSTQKYTNKLAGKHVLVIGGTSGIGFAVAEASLESDATVTISSSKSTTIESAITRLTASYPTQASGGRLRGFTCDLAGADLEANVEKLFEQVGKVDHIVFTAGDRLAIKPLQEHTLASIQAAGQIRFFAPLIIAKIGSRYLSAGPEASITLTTGSVSLKPAPNWSVVASYASGMHGMTRNLALDLRPVRVNLVSPGLTVTTMWDHMAPEARTNLFQAFGARVPTGSVGSPEDVAECYLWLMKDKNVTGAVVQSDSGTMLV